MLLKSLILVESPKFWILSGSRVRREPNYKTRNKLTTLFSNRHIKCLKCSTRCGFQDSSQDLIEVWAPDPLFLSFMCMEWWVTSWHILSLLYIYTHIDNVCMYDIHCLGPGSITMPLNTSNNKTCWKRMDHATHAWWSTWFRNKCLSVKNLSPFWYLFPMVLS